MRPRIGLGYDAHRLAEGRKLILGGIEVPFEKGLEAHSDGDVLLHALMDAMLGAAGLPDIGRLFPDSDPAYKDACSLELLKRVSEAVREAGYELGNADVVVICQAPKISGYVEEMRRAISGAIGCPEEAIGVRGTTTERMGYTGRGEGIAAQAVAMLFPRD